MEFYFRHQALVRSLTLHIRSAGIRVTNEVQVGGPADISLTTSCGGRSHGESSTGTGKWAESPRGSK